MKKQSEAACEGFSQLAASGIAILAVLCTLLISQTDLSLHDGFWWMSLVLQWIAGVKFLDSLLGTFPHCAVERRVLGLIVGIAVYSFVYQILIAATESMTQSWLGTHLVMALATYFVARSIKIPGVSSAPEVSIGTRLQHSLVLGCVLLVLGVTELRSLFPLGTGMVGFSLLTRIQRTSKAPLLTRLSRKAGTAIFLAGFITTLCINVLVDRPFGRHWWVTSNDLQTSLTHAVSLSRSGMWNDLRMVGHKQTHHWSITGWSGMNWPFGALETGIGVHLKLLLAGLLVGAMSTLVSRLADSCSRIRVSDFFASAIGLVFFYRVGWDSHSSVFGHSLFLVTLALLLDSTQPKNHRRGRFPLLLIVCLTATWANALNLPLIVLFATFRYFLRSPIVQSIRKLFRTPHDDFRRLILILPSCFVAWIVLFTPSAKPRAFLIELLQPRDFLFPVLARRLPHGFLGEITAPVIIELVTQSYLVACLCLGIAYLRSRKIYGGSSLPLFGFSLFILCLPLALSVDGSTEIIKIRFVGQLCTAAFVAVMCRFVFATSFEKSNTKKWRILAVSAVIMVIMFSLSLRISLGAYDPQNFLRESFKWNQIFVALSPLIAVISLIIFRAKLSEYVSSLTFVAVVIGLAAGGSVGYQIAEFGQRREIASTQLEFEKWQLRLMPDAVVEVGNWIRTNTPSEAIIASNYFCDIGRECPSDIPLTSLSAADIWKNQKADQSNLVAYSQRQFLVQSPRHLWGNALMPDIAVERVRASLDFAASRNSLRQLVEMGVTHFVLDLDSSPKTDLGGWPRPIFLNERFGVFEIYSP